MKDLKVYLPNAKFLVGVLISLAVLSVVIKLGSSNRYVQIFRGWIGLAPSAGFNTVT